MSTPMQTSRLSAVPDYVRMLLCFKAARVDMIITVNGTKKEKQWSQEGSEPVEIGILALCLIYSATKEVRPSDPRRVTKPTTALAFFSGSIGHKAERKIFFKDADTVYAPTIPRGTKNKSLTVGEGRKFHHLI